MNNPGASPSDWRAFAPWNQDLLPVACDPAARVSPASSLKSIGKVPSQYGADGMVVGLRGWTAYQATADDIARWSTTPGIGICLQTRDVRAIDIDVDDPELADRVESLVTLLIGECPVRRRAGSGRRVLLLRVPGPLRKRRVTVDGGVVELLGDGQQVVVAGTHVTSGQRLTMDWREGVPEVEVSDLDALWVALGGSTGGGAVAERRVATALEHVGPGTVADLRSALAALDCTDYDTWVQMGSALRGLGEVGWELWSEWSAGDERWDIGEGAEKWDGLGHDTIRYVSVFARASAAGWVNPAAAAGPADADEFEDTGPPTEVVSAREIALEYWLGRVAGATEAGTVRDGVCSGIVSDRRLDALARETLAQAVAGRLKALGQPAGVAAVRGLLKPAGGATVVADSGKARWSDDWVYLNHQDVFVNRHTKLHLTNTSFRARMNREVTDKEREAASLAGVGLDSVRIALDFHKIPNVSFARYAPWLDEVFVWEGEPAVNTFKPASVPAALPPNGSERYVIEHLDKLLGPEIGAVLIQWMAHNVQRPGRKIRWAPLIKGLEGDGKSLLGGLMMGVMGISNVTVVSPSAIRSEFNGWAEGHCLAILEEVRENGHNRYDIVNRLKPLITNDVVSVHSKGVNEYSTINTQNYIAFTNHEDALPMDAGGRRWWVVRSQIETVAELEEKMPASYFRTLHQVIRDNARELRGWLLSVSLDGFDAEGRAPETEAKKRMAQMTRHEGDEELEDALEEGGYGYNKDIVIGMYLRAALPGVWPSTRALVGSLSRAGFGPSQQVKVDGKNVRCYVRGKKSHHEAAELARKVLGSS